MIALFQKLTRRSAPLLLLLAAGSGCAPQYWSYRSCCLPYGHACRPPLPFVHYCDCPPPRGECYLPPERPEGVPTVAPATN